MSGRPDLAPGGLDAPKGAPIVVLRESSWTLTSVRRCLACGAVIPWGRRANGFLEARWSYARRRTCSRACAYRTPAALAAHAQGAVLFDRLRAEGRIPPRRTVGRAARLREILARAGLVDVLGVAVCAAVVFRREGELAARRFVERCAADRWARASAQRTWG